MLSASRAITLTDLPSPPKGEIGWPWTEPSASSTAQMLDGAECPRISIVTPSYNQGQFIEETIRSVLLQGYPNLEYIIIDGGSTDNSVEIIRKYEHWITYWISEPDQGQSDAINKGFSHSTGQILGWLNSDDLLANSALLNLALAYQPGLHWWYGDALQMLPDQTLKKYPRLKGRITRNVLLHARIIVSQVSTFWTRELWEQTGASLSLYHMAMDYELWLRFSEYVPAIVIDDVLGIFRTHDNAKTGTEAGRIAYLEECDLIRIKEYKKKNHHHFSRLFLITFWTRLHLARECGWRSWIGRRPIPYV